MEKKGCVTENILPACQVMITHPILIRTNRHDTDKLTQLSVYRRVNALQNSVIFTHFNY